MIPKIQDEFTALPISRQRKYQLRQQKKKLCTECPQPALEGATRCAKHIIIARERQRKKKGCTKRYLKAISYTLPGGQVPEVKP